MTQSKTPYQVVAEVYALPLTPREKQLEVINKLAPLPRTGMYCEVGTGKTLMFTVIALYKLITQGSVTLVVMPPILLLMWEKWLARIPGVSVLKYRGTPKDRRNLDLNADFILMSLPIFKNDFDFLVKEFGDVPRLVGVDEATAIKNVASQNHKRVKEFTEGHELSLLTGTPLSTPGDAYAYVKLVAPGVYRNQRHFDQLHVAERDFFENVVKWDNLEFLRDNMLLNSARLYKKDALPDLAEPQYVPLPYELDPVHMRLYKKLADEQLLLLESGGKIDASTPSKLYNALQQIICNPGHFSGDPTMRSAAHDMLDMVLDSIGAGKPGGEKLFVCANYRMTNRGLLQYLSPYKAVAIYSEVSDAGKARAIDQFVNDPDCWVCLVNPISGGVGLDDFARVCSHGLAIELPVIPKDFHQWVGRLWRDGQKSFPTIHMPKAVGTIQVTLAERLMVKDALVNRVQGGWKNLRDAIHGVVA